MQTYQITEPVLDRYRNERLSEERISSLIAQANEQLEEIAQNQSLYERFIKEVDAPENIDKTILWMLLMSNEDIVEEYIDEFGKKYREIIPVSDLADLLVYVFHLKKLKDTELEGFDVLMEYDEQGMAEADQYAFTNILLHVQRTKEATIEF